VLLRLGWDVQGIEISHSAAKFSRQKLNVPTYAGTLPEFISHRPNEKYPLILAIDLLEHLIEPESFFTQVNQVIERDGLLILDTPNGNSANISKYGSEWQGFNPFHLFIFSFENLSHLLKKYGFEIQKVFSHGNLSRTEVSFANPHPNIIRERFKTLMYETQLVTLAKHLRRQLYEFQDTPNRHENLRESILKIRTGQDYFCSNDSSGKLAKDCQGDNLVIIAKKTN
jgi:2-polyprenyl-3-methyl-5-hydroxy-6-metoxy-1,4-benzoquinol methylase